MGQRVGYIRVSTAEQNTGRQLDGEKLDRTFTDKASGKDRERPALSQAITYVRDGDTLVVHSMDRLARNLLDLRRIVEEVVAKGARVQFLKEGQMFSGEGTASATFLLNIMGAFAEFERALIRERQREGIVLAKAKGVYKGRKRALTPEQVQTLQVRALEGVRKTALARELSVSRETVHRYLRQGEAVAMRQSTVKVAAPSSAPARKTIELTFWLELLPYNKWVKTSRLIADIEAWLSLRFHAVTVARGCQYRLRVTYTRPGEIEAQMEGLWQEIGIRAEAHRCDVQGDILDDQERSWGDGEFNRRPERYLDLAPPQ